MAGAATVDEWRSTSNGCEAAAGQAPRTLPLVLRCAGHLQPKVRYVFDTLLMAAGVPVQCVTEPPAHGPWLLYAPTLGGVNSRESCLFIPHAPEAWRLFDRYVDVDAASAAIVDGLAVVLAQRPGGGQALARGDSGDAGEAGDINFDLIANAFYFLASWSERVGMATGTGVSTSAGMSAGTSARTSAGTGRQLFAQSVYVRLGIPQDIVDRYLALLMQRLHALCVRLRVSRWAPPSWPGGAEFALVLSHDVDFVPSGPRDMALQGAKTLMRHLVRQRDPVDALRAARGLARAWRAGRDPYGCLPEIIAREKELGLRASFQVAVGHRHPHDVNYRIEDDRVRDYLRVIPDSGFDLCLHGSVRSTEQAQWYVDEAELLTQRLGRPLGSRQHFLSFNYDTLFTAQEQAGIDYDMSMGFPDQPGPRAGFSFPYFPYNLAQDRPFRVLQISLFLMDVTLRGYLRLKGAPAWAVIERCLTELKQKRGCASAVWHPIVFGGARDPGDDALFWRMAQKVVATGGVATDGRTINRFWRERAGGYASFSARTATPANRSTSAATPPTLSVSPSLAASMSLSARTP